MKRGLIMTRKRVVVIEGDDAAPEAVRPTLELLDRLNLNIEWLTPPIGDQAKERYGSTFPDQARRAIDESDATFFGAASGKSTAALFYLRFGKQTFANVRPVKWLPGFKSPLADPKGLDLVIIRENLEDLYLGVEGETQELDSLNLTSPFTGEKISDMAPGRYALKVITEKGTARVTRFAFELARKRKEQGRPGKVTCATKHNMLFRSDGFFREVAQKIAGSFLDIVFESLIVDDFAHRLAANPQQFDVAVMPNLYGDILSDMAGGLIGGLGLAPSGCYGENYAYFEPVHGTAPDIAGKHIINPTATILSAAMMLDYLGFKPEAERMEQAVQKVYAEGRTLPRDQGGSATTEEFAAAVKDFL
jgi:isocitrate/isopropylmalate dehydrogenase